MRKSPIPVALLVTFLTIPCHGMGPQSSASGAAPQQPRIVNIIHFIRLCEPRDERITEEVLYETVVRQVRIMQQHDLGGTFLLQYDALLDERYQKLLRGLPPDSFEIGAWWEIPQPLVENAGMTWRGRFPWDWHADVGFSTGYTPAEREKLVDVYMRDFKRIFGAYPESVGSWFIDAHTLNYLHEKYGIVASCNCKDQVGTDGYTLWGGYWNQAYYPSRLNSYMPAQHAEKQIPVPVFRMLGSDPIRQYDQGIGSGRQGVITLEPVYREGGGDASWVNWYFREFVQGECLAFAYVQAGQENSFTWDAMARGYELQMPLIARLRDEHQVTVRTLAESGRWFKERYPVTPATAVTVQRDLPGSDRRTVWFNSRFYRANLIWEEGSLRFRDIHVFDENLPSEYLTEPVRSNECNFSTLPVIDGHLWSTRELLAGLRLEAVTNGAEIPVRGGDPKITQPEPGTLRIAWPLTSIPGTLVLSLDERHMEITLQDSDSPQWFLDLTVADQANVPFTRITPGRVQCRFRDRGYSMVLERGAFSVPDPKTAFRVTPSGQAIAIRFELAD